MIDAKTVGTTPVSPSVRRTRRRRYHRAATSFVGGTHIAGFGI